MKYERRKAENLDLIIKRNKQDRNIFELQESRYDGNSGTGFFGERGVAQIKILIPPKFLNFFERRRNEKAYEKQVNLRSST